MFTPRADRLATVYVFHPLRKLIDLCQRVRIPILMYHSISEVSGQRMHPYYQITTSPQVFAEHIKFLHEHKYSVIRLAQVAKHVGSGEHAPEHTVVITFDDGYRDFYTYAFPILSSYGFSATVFLPTAYIGRVVQKFKGRDCLTWSEVRELHRAGMDFGSHTVTHPQLKSVPTADLEHEIQCSKQTIEDRLGHTVQSFSYPFAFPEEDSEFKTRLRRTLEKHGYENGVCTVIGTVGQCDDRFFLKRLPVNSWDDPSFFQAKLEGGYDWLHPVQYVRKFIGRRLFGRSTRSTAGRAHYGDQD